MSTQAHDTHTEASSAHGSFEIPAWRYVAASAVVVPVFIGALVFGSYAQMPASSTTPVASGTSSTSSSSTAENKSKPSQSKQGAESTSHTTVVTEEKIAVSEEKEQPHLTSKTQPETPVIAAAQKQDQKVVALLNSERTDAEKLATTLKNQILQARQKQLDGCNPLARKMSAEYESIFQETFNSSDIKSLIRLKSTDPKTFNKAPIDSAALVKTFNQRVLESCKKSQDANERNAMLSDKAIQDLMIQLAQSNQKISKLGGASVDLPTPEELQLDDLEAARKKIREIPVPQYSVEEFKTALGSDLPPVKSAQPLQPTQPVAADSLAAVDEFSLPQPNNQPQVKEKLQPKPQEKPVSELERVLKTKGFKTDFKEARISTVLVRVKELAQSETVTFDCSDDLAKERVTITVGEKTIQDILDEAAKQVSGKVVQKDNLLKIVKSISGKREAEDAGRRIRGVIGR